MSRSKSSTRLINIVLSFPPNGQLLWPNGHFKLFNIKSSPVTHSVSAPPTLRKKNDKFERIRTEIIQLLLSWGGRFLQSAALVSDVQERVQNLLEYLIEYNRLKSPPKLQISEYNWQLSLTSLPIHPSIEVFIQAPEESEERTLLQVSRLSNVKCISAAIQHAINTRCPG